MADNPPLLIQLIFPFSPEWIQLVATLWAEYVADGVFSREQVEAMMDPEQHKVSWLPQGRYHQLASLGGFVGNALVGSVDVLQRDQETAIVEQLAVHPDHRQRGYGRRLVREAVAIARRTGRLPILGVFTFERDPKAIEFWRHLLGVPPNAEGYGLLLGERLPAVGWRLRTAEILV